MAKMEYGTYMDMVGAKINDAKDSLMTGINEEGFMHRAERIRTSASNFWFSASNTVNEPVGAMFKSFSETAGLSDVDNVAGVDLVDINIMATQQSVMSYLSAERAMDKPTDIAWYQKLVAINDAGGFTKGEDVLNPYSPLPTKINLGAVVTAKDVAVDSDGDVEIQLDAKPLVKKQVTIIAKNGSGEVVATGSDLKGDGVIYWDNGTACDTATVNYDTAKVTLNGVVASVAAVLSATANIDRTSQGDGANTLKVKPKTETVVLTAKPNRIIMENSFEENMFINKQAYNLSNVGVQLDFGKRAINQLLRSFVNYLDVTSVTKTAEVMLGQAPSDELDYTDYLISTSEASTKNDIVNQYVLKLNKNLQTKSGKGPTAYLVDSEAAIILGNNPMYFTPNDAFTQNLDGLIGTYNKIPVIRHHALNGILDTAEVKYGFLGTLYKDPSGATAPTMYGEFLPPYSITPALNYQNPSQFSQGLFSQSVTDKLVPELASYMKIIVATND